MLGCVILLAGFSALDAEGWTILEPAADARIVYVSSSEGDDGNSGLSETDPVATIDRGKDLIREDYPDWLLLKAGDEWVETFGRWREGGGRSADEPKVIGSYGTGERPKVKCGLGRGIYFRDTGLAHIAIVGIELYAHTRDPDSPDYVDDRGSQGIYCSADNFDGFLVEGCLIRFFDDNLIIQDRRNDSATNLTIRRNVIVDSYSTEGHSQGLFFRGIDGVLIEENVFDHNGWVGSREGGREAGGATKFNHNIYVSNGSADDAVNQNVTVRNNIICRASSHGIQLRVGGVLAGNVFLRNPLPIQFGGGTDFWISHPNGVGGLVTGNVVLETNDISSETPRGLALKIENANGADVLGNIIAHDISDESNTRGIRLFGRDSLTSNVSIRDNIIYKHRRGGVHYVGEDFADIEVVGNYLWDAEIPEGNFDSEQTTWTDPERSIASYHQSVGGAASFESFIDEARKQSKDNWRDDYTADAVASYIEEGFDQP